MKKLSVYIIAIATLLTSSLAYADNGDVYTGSNNQLSIPSIIIGNTIYTGVVITVGSVLSIAGSTTKPTTLTVPFQAAMANLINHGFNKTYQLSGLYQDGNTPYELINGSGTIIVGKPILQKITSGPLNGKNALLSTMIVSGEVIGKTFYFYDADNYSLLGCSLLGDSLSLLFEISKNLVYFVPYTIPKIIQSGNTGSLGMGKDDQGNIFSTVYSVSSDTATTLLVTITDTFSSNIDLVTSTVYRIDTIGNIDILSKFQKVLHGNLYKKELNYIFS